ncbi:MAG: 4-hydroxy-tetrahydrodipicolinate synthase [Deltaproteobacteria bacterium]|nr:4-hydroxy-tetrahydrodipicolinate synthase [Deltaproteobacteria bacterium]
MTSSKFIGTGVAIVTPFRKDDSIDFNSLGNLIEYLINNKVNYIVVLGTTGETPTLTSDEKKAVANFVIEAVNKRVPVVVGIGGNSTQDVIDKIKEVEFDGIDAVLSVAPYYNKPGQKGIYAHFQAIVSSCPVPVIIYNVPGRTGCNITAETTLRLAHDFNKQFVGIKEASGNFQQIMKIIQDKPSGFLVISGDDAITLPLISIGASGVISVVANAFPKEFSNMVNKALEMKYHEARVMHYKLLEIIENLFVEGSPAGIKAALNILGLVQNQVRMPLTPVSRTTYNKLAELIKEIKIK